MKDIFGKKWLWSISLVILFIILFGGLIEILKYWPTRIDLLSNPENQNEIRQYNLHHLSVKPGIWVIHSCNDGFTWTDDINNGIVGGKFTGGYAEGNMIANLALRIIMSEKASNIPLQKSPTLYMFDYEQLVKWIIDPQSLPPNPKIINEPYSFYREYKLLIWSVLIIIAILSFMIIFLIINSIRRKNIEAALTESETRFRDMTEMLPVAVFETNKEVMIKYANYKAFELFGYTEDDFRKGLSGFHMISEEDRERAADNLRKRIRGQIMGIVDYEGIKKDGTKFPILFQMNPIYSENEITGFRGVILDITDRKQVEESLVKAWNVSAK